MQRKPLIEFLEGISCLVVIGKRESALWAPYIPPCFLRYLGLEFGLVFTSHYCSLEYRLWGVRRLPVPKREKALVLGQSGAHFGVLESTSMPGYYSFSKGCENTQ